MKQVFFFVTLLFNALILTVQAQVSIAPLYQYSVGATSNAQLRTTSTTIQDDTLKLPFIEDFSGPGIPIDTITAEVFIGSTLVYQIKQLKLHGLSSSDYINVFNAVNSNATEIPVNGPRYAKVIDKYTFQLFNDAALTDPTIVDATAAGRMNYCNWVRFGAYGYSTTPDSLGFLNNNGGVFINNDMGVNPISIGVATFDGINYLGVFYSSATPPAKGYGDNLTSLPFDLSGKTQDDSIYMSFYWQAQGLGDAPITTEFLSLEFLNSSNQWIQVWKILGPSQTMDTFKIEMIEIMNSSYLYNGFKYRFRSYGVLNGRFNVWNIDYIYINEKRNPVNPYTKDITISETSSSILKNYTAIPYKHINSLPVSDISNETNDGFMKINDFRTPTVGGSINCNHLIRDNLTSLPIKFETKVQNYDATNAFYSFTMPLKDTIPGSRMTEPYVIKEEFYFPIYDVTDPFDMSFNNFTAIETYFDDYYAYDDNIPELTIMSINPGGIRMANEYKILKRDTLTDIDYCFLKNNGPDLTNLTFYLNVWQTGPTISSSSTLLNQQASISYSSDINGFVRYSLSTPIVLDSGASYYIGFTQNFNYQLFLGYDRNNDQLSKIFTSKDGQIWDPFSASTDITGALMIRPVFENGEILTSVLNSELSESKFNIYPNPSIGQLHFTGEPEYIMIYDLSGLLIQENKIEDEPISTESIANGLYVILLSKGEYKEVKRLIIQK